MRTAVEKKTTTKSLMKERWRWEKRDVVECDFWDTNQQSLSANQLGDWQSHFVSV